MNTAQHIGNGEIVESEIQGTTILQGMGSDMYDINSNENSIAKRNFNIGDQKIRTMGIPDEFNHGSMNLNSTEEMLKNYDEQKGGSALSKKNYNKSNLVSGQSLDNVLMQVNKYVHPCERIPSQIKPDDIEKFEADYEIDTNERIKEYLR